VTFSDARSEFDTAIRRRWTTIFAGGYDKQLDQKPWVHATKPGNGIEKDVVCAFRNPEIRTLSAPKSCKRPLTTLNVSLVELFVTDHDGGWDPALSSSLTPCTATLQPLAQMRPGSFD
jgi:hypothetical protein